MRESRYKGLRRVSCRTFWFGVVFLVASSSATYAQGEVTILLDSTAQVIRGFGAANIVQWRPDMTEGEIETAFGTGEGQLGLSILRLRIPPNQNDWSVNLPSATKTHEMGATIIASPWSPPASMKTNNNLIGGELREDMYQAFADYLNDFTSYMDNQGIPIYGVSVQNEPDITVGYESCDYSPEQMRKFVAENGASINTRLIAPESFQFRRSMSDPMLNDSAATANLDIVGGHIYGGGNSSYPLAEEKGKEVWMTEYLMNLNTGSSSSPAWDTYSDVERWEETMDMLSTIHRSMKNNMNAYIWWYLKRYYSFLGDGQFGETNGEPTQRGYAFSQFSKYVRPGYVRLHSDGPLGRGYVNVLVTAYVDTTSRTLVIVAINDEGSDKEINFDIEGLGAGTFKRYVTSVDQSVEELEDVSANGSTLSVTLPTKTVTTFVSNYSPVSAEESAVPQGSSQLSQNYPNPFHSSTKIVYSLPNTGDVKLEVFDLLGRRVATLESGMVSAGRHEVAVEASQFSPGIYLYRLTFGDVVQTRMLTLAE